MVGFLWCVWFTVGLPLVFERVERFQLSDKMHHVAQIIEAVSGLISFKHGFVYPLMGDHIPGFISDSAKFNRLQIDSYYSEGQ
jgi:hypothetical protein